MMKRVFRKFFLLLAALLWSIAASAQVDTISDNFDSQDSIRINPDIVYEVAGGDVAIPGFIRRSANHIEMNGADWSALKAKSAAGDGVISVVHIGDSHIQAEIGTSVTREMLQLRFGNAGRGLLSPRRLAGTNQPYDYRFESSRQWSSEKFMRAPWTNPMGFNGASLTLNGGVADITLSTVESDDDYNPFTRVTVFYSGEMIVTGVSDGDGIEVPATVVTSPGMTTLELWTSQTRVKIGFTMEGRFTLFGATLSGERPGVVYHAIGNNGATYSTYNRIASLGSGVAALDPDLIIISLGANEAFGRLELAAFRRSVSQMISTLRRENPQAQLLIVTPMECQRKQRKSRRRSATYVVNSNILPLRNELL
ncbi:MAG: GDSL-type esterase/lipase family protein, partial [Roseburia sp.]|nr:GDSL-type esterase/lipase family protein [Roseburia sp.]